VELRAWWNRFVLRQWRGSNFFSEFWDKFVHKDGRHMCIVLSEGQVCNEVKFGQVRSVGSEGQMCTDGKNGYLCMCMCMCIQREGMYMCVQKEGWDWCVWWDG